MEQTNKKRAIIITVTVVAACILIFGLWQYFTYRSECQDKFPVSTVINGVKCGGLTDEQVIEKLDKIWNSRQFTVTENGKTVQVIKNFNFDYNIEKDVKALHTKIKKYPLYMKLFGNEDELSVKMVPAKLTKTFTSQFDKLPMLGDSDAVKTQNAYINMSNTDFDIVPEIYGEDIDRDLLQEKILSMIAKNQWKLNYKKKDFYVVPTVKKNDKKLINKQKYCRTYLTQKITYTFGSETYVISPKTLDSLVKYDSAGKATVNTKEVDTFIANLASKYTTVGAGRSFRSTSRGTVYVSGGTYGHSIDVSAEKKQLIADLKAGKDVTRQAIFSSDGWQWTTNDIGSTYVEVDLGSQHMWYYENGKAVVDCDFVSGNIAGNTPTVSGVFYLVYKAQDVELKGRNTDGTKYVSKVNYWMPFYSDYGLHDASWRGKFGGKIYRTGGSHGCVNMPYAGAQALYNRVSAGCPVIVFY